MLACLVFRDIKSLLGQNIPEIVFRSQLHRIPGDFMLETYYDTASQIHYKYFVSKKKSRISILTLITRYLSLIMWLFRLHQLLLLCFKENYSVYLPFFLATSIDLSIALSYILPSSGTNNHRLAMQSERESCLMKMMNDTENIIYTWSGTDKKDYMRALRSSWQGNFMFFSIRYTFLSRWNYGKKCYYFFIFYLYM